MATPYQAQEEILVAPLTFSILITSPIRRNISFSPVSAVLFPLARVKLPYAGFVVAALDIFISFLIKRSIVNPPHFFQTPSPNQPTTLTMKELWELLQKEGQPPLQKESNPLWQTSQTAPIRQVAPLRQAPHLGQGSLPGEQLEQSLDSTGSEDEPLFPENLAFSLALSGPLRDKRGIPDSSFNVPLFELPGTPGNLIISFVTLLAQLIIELTPLSSNTPLGGESS